MLRRSHVCLAAEFKQKSRWSAVWPNMHYGAMYLNYSVGRQLPMRGVNWVTRDSNRLTNFHDRYASVIADIDVKRNEEELHIQMGDIRWNDHRRIYWRCSFCGSQYRKNVSVRTRYHAGCNACKRRYASEVMRDQQLISKTLQEAQPQLVKSLCESNAATNGNIAQLSEASKFPAEWTCSKCRKPYRASIRSRTGVVEEGQCKLHPHVTEWSSFCLDCAWGENMKALGEKTLKEGQFLGLDESIVTGKSAKPIPRRKKLVV